MKIGERGQVTIPKRLRERFGLAQGAEVEFLDQRGQLVMQKKALPATDPWSEVVGIVKGKIKNVDAFIEKVRGR